MAASSYAYSPSTLSAVSASAPPSGRLTRQTVVYVPPLSVCCIVTSYAPVPRVVRCASSPRCSAV